MNNTKPTHTEIEKAKALRRVIYSINMVVYTHEYLIKTQTDLTANIYTNNCHLESFLAHVRNLINFFNCSTRQDDITIDDFTDNFTKNENWNSIKKSISKSLSHLTYYEIDNKPKWYIGNITRELYPKCLAFLEDMCFDNYILEPQVDKIRLKLLCILKGKLENT